MYVYKHLGGADKEDATEGEHDAAGEEEHAAEEGRERDLQEDHLSFVETYMIIYIYIYIYIVCVCVCVGKNESTQCKKCIHTMFQAGLEQDVQNDALHT
jgi:hypothetical protein